MKEKRVLLLYDRKKVFFKILQRKILQEFAAFKNILVKNDEEPILKDLSLSSNLNVMAEESMLQLQNI